MIRNNPALLDFSDQEAWKNHYIRKEALSKEWELMVDEPIPDVFTIPLLTKECCELIIQAAEESNAWTSDRHAYYPATDMEIEVFGFQQIYHSLLKEFMYPMACKMWHLEGGKWRGLQSENFIIKYQPEVQGHLALHHDSSVLTCNVLLNTEFEGGGTYFAKQRKLYKPTEPGIALIHPGVITHRHGSRPVTAGTRYVLISFCRE